VVAASSQSALSPVAFSQAGAAVTLALPVPSTVTPVANVRSSVAAASPRYTNGVQAPSAQALTPVALVRTPAPGASARYANGVQPPATQALTPVSLTQSSASGQTSPFTNGVRSPVVSTVLPTNVPPFGDVDCSNTVNAVDALKVLRKNAGLSVAQSEPCTDIAVALPNGKLQGDVDCGGAVNAVDSLKLLRFGAGLAVSQAAGCPLIGQ